MALVRPAPGGCAVDLGCGTGRLTARLHRARGLAETVGIDTSEAMLAQATRWAGGGVRFVREAVESVDLAPTDLIFSNAALHWVSDHAALLPRLAAAVRPGGQLAFQVPVNEGHVSHRTAREVAASAPFAAALGDAVAPTPVREPEWYDRALRDHGFAERVVRVQVYGHELASREAVIDWVRGTTLTPYQRALSLPLWEAFLASYTERLMGRLPDERPFYYPYRRLLVWARRET